jgi:hypothetical protein
LENNLNTALALIVQHYINQLLIKENDKFARLLSHTGIIRFIQVSQD